MSFYSVQIDQEHKIPKGNFSLLEHSRLHPSVIDKMMKAERMTFINAVACISTLRSAYEAFAYEMQYLHMLDQGEVPEGQSREMVIAGIRELCKIKKNGSKSYSKTDSQAGSQTDSGSERTDKRINCNTLLRDLAADYIQDQKKLYTVYRILFREPKYKNIIPSMKGFKDCIFHYYSLLSDRIHNNTATSEDAVRCVNALWLFVSGFLRIEENFLCSRIPYDDLYEVPAELYQVLRLNSNENAGVYVQETKNGLNWFLLKAAQPNGNRDLTVLERLWDAPDTPENILRIREGIGQGKNSRRVFCFPSRPYALDSRLLAELSATEKDQLIRGILHAVSSLHSMTPAYAHRALTPDCFYVCRISERIKPLLACFYTVKDPTADPAATVYSSVEAQRKQAYKQPFLAPELAAPEGRNDWLPADIYSAGVLIRWIYTGSSAPEEKTSALPGGLGELVHRMTDSIPDKRPDISTVLREFSTGTVQPFCYAVAVDQGPRKRQEDAFFCTGEPVLQQKQGSFSGICSDIGVLAVFDGIGGGDGGDVLSLQAAQSFQQSFSDNERGHRFEWSGKLRSALECADRRVHETIQAEDFFGAGCSAAAAITDGETVKYVNLGDSRIYLFHDRKLQQLSVDHRASDGRHAALYQYLGLPEEDGEPVPKQGTCRLADGDLLLLCTDGLNDYVTDEEMAGVLQKAYTGQNGLEQTAQELVTLARDQRSRDNITVVLCRKGR